MHATTSRTFTTLGEVEGLVQRFEAGRLPQAEWDQAARLTVALWNLLHHPEHVATARTIEGIRAHNRAHGIRQTSEEGYHETVTLFWLVITRRFIDRLPRRDVTLELFNAFVDELAPREALIYEHYSPQRLRSAKARQQWVAPDLRPL